MLTREVVETVESIGIGITAAARSPDGVSLLFDADRNGLRRTVEALYVTCAAQASERGVEPEAFATLFRNPDVFERASVALLFAVANYFPESPVAPVINATLAHCRKARTNR